MRKFLITFLNNYLPSLPYYLFASGIAFLVDITIYVLSWQYIGTNLSSLLAFSFGICVLYFILRLTRRSRYKKKRYGLIIQLLIGVVSLCINLLILNCFDWIYFELIGGDTKNMMYVYYPLCAKFISSCFGFLASSNLTIKFNFNLKESRDS